MKSGKGQFSSNHSLILPVKKLSLQIPSELPLVSFCSELVICCSIFYFTWSTTPKLSDIAQRQLYFTLRLCGSGTVMGPCSMIYGVLSWETVLAGDDVKTCGLTWKSLHSHVWHLCWEVPKLGFSRECWPAHLHILSPCDLGFLTAWWRNPKKRHSDQVFQENLMDAAWSQKPHTITTSMFY